MECVADLEHAIRDRINHSSFLYQYLRDQGAWNRVCSALDILGDSEIALDSWEASPGVEDLGMRYVIIFGVLQLLIVQQDAADHLSTPFGVKSSGDLLTARTEIRDIRNSSIGHPVLRDDGSSHHLTRATLSTHGFQMISYGPDGKPELRNVTLRELVTKQRRLLAAKLTETLQRAIALENEHRQRFRSDTLASTIDDYLLQNLWRSVHESQRAPMGASSIKMVRDAIDAFEKGLVARVPTSPLTQELGSIRHALNRLERYFQLPAPAAIDRADADVFVSHVVDRLGHLSKLAAEIDAEFEKDVS